MLRFFSKKRYKLAAENRTGKYLRYAVGEILLVVIGIVIALQLDNWNSERKTHNEEMQLYRTLLEDINNEYRKLGDDKLHITRYQDFYYHLMEENNGNAGYREFQHYNYLNWFHRYEAFINEKYTASMSLITNEKIIQIIKNEEDTQTLYEIDRSGITYLGYAFLRKDRIQNAVKIFKLNTELNPHWNTFDSYGEGLLALGDIENGIQAYRKSLELNPDNSNAKEVLEKYAK